MVGVPGKNTPTNDAEWARSIEQRLHTIESGSSAVAIGNWTLAVDDGGELIAVAPGKNPVALTATLSPAEEARAAETVAAALPPPTMSSMAAVMGLPIGGTFTLTFTTPVPSVHGGAGPEPTAAIDWDATSTEIQAAIVASGDYDQSQFTVVGPDGGPWGIMHPVGVFSSDGTGLTGGTNPYVQIT